MSFVTIPRKPIPTARPLAGIVRLSLRPNHSSSMEARPRTLSVTIAGNVAAELGWQGGDRAEVAFGQGADAGRLRLIRRPASPHALKLVAYPATGTLRLATYRVPEDFLDRGCGLYAVAWRVTGERALEIDLPAEWLSAPAEAAE